MTDLNDKEVEMIHSIAVDETGTGLLPFPHILAKTEQTPTAYKAFFFNLLSVKVLYFVEAIPNNIPCCHKKKKITTRKGSLVFIIIVEQSHVDSSWFKG